MHVLSKRSYPQYYMEEFKNFELKIDVKINQGGNSGVYVKSQWQEGIYPTTGFELQVNLSQQEPQKTGSLYDIIRISEAPHEADEWFTYHIICNGNRIDVFINGEMLYYYTDPGQGNPLPITEQTKRINQSGYIALQQHDPGSSPRFRNIHVRKLPDWLTVIDMKLYRARHDPFLASPIIFWWFTIGMPRIDQVERLWGR